jgi:hypothetical protein
LRELRADYGKKIVDHLAIALSQEFGLGFGRRNLFNMIRFAEVFSDHQIVQTLSAQLSWSHILEIFPIEEPLKREFYTELARLHRWSVRTLRDRIRSMLFERTVFFRKPEELIQQEIALLRDEDRLSPDMVLRNPYLMPLDWRTLKARKNWRTQSSGRWRRFSWKSEMDSPLRHDRNRSLSEKRLSAWTCCCTIANSGGWLP